MQYHLAIAVALLVGLTTPIKGQIRWSYTSLDQALRMAGDSGKHVFVDTYTPTCVPCKVMDQNLKDPALAQYFNEHFINVKINMNGREGRSVKDEYDLVFLPTLMLLTPDGSVRYKVDRVIDASELLSKVRQTIEQNVRFDDASVVSNSPLHKRSKITDQQALPKPRSTTLPPDKGETAPADVESEERVLLVLDGNNGKVPPEVLRQEAYFRLSLGDGSHQTTAQQYLDTQRDWSTRENLQFVYDFLQEAQGPLFDYFVAHRPDFIRLVGPEEINRTMHILINRQLEEGYPRPGLQEVQRLFGLLGKTDSVALAYEYTLDLMLSEGRELSYIELFPQYLSVVGLDDHQRIHQGASVFLKNGRPRVAATTSNYIAWLEHAVTLAPDQPEYYQTLSHLYLLSDDMTQAKAYFQKAKEVAQKYDLDFTPDRELQYKLRD